MTEGMNSYEEDPHPERTQQSSKLARISGMATAAIFVLGIVLPPEYRAYVPLLFLIPLIMAVVDKVRQVRQKNEYSPYAPGQDPTVEPYSYTPKDPNDPRRYRPIG